MTVEACTEAQLARGFGKQHRKVAARTPAAVEGLIGRLRPLNFAALILDALRDAANRAIRPVSRGVGFA